MNNISVSRSFGFSTRTLQRDAQLLLGALQDGQVGPPILGKLPSTFIADFTAQLALVAQRATDATGAIGAVSRATQTQTDALTVMGWLTAAARTVAKTAFAGQDTILRAEFQVGSARPRNFADAVERGRNLVAACQKYAVELAPFHWTADNSTQLSTALDALVGGDASHGAISSEKIGATAQRNDAANGLYRKCVLVQAWVRAVYPSGQAASDPAVAEARKRFLLDVFPPRKKATAVVTPVTPSVPVTVTPVAPAQKTALVVGAPPMEALGPEHRLEAAA
jgi:hypothetical protein